MHILGTSQGSQGNHLIFNIISDVHKCLKSSGKNGIAAQKLSVRLLMDVTMRSSLIKADVDRARYVHIFIRCFASFLKSIARTAAGALGEV